MRITSKIIQNNSLSNINTNKLIQDQLSNQLSTKKKINRPSDDPVIAIRALRLRTNVSQVTQYYEKNAPDAESWMKITEDALKTVTEVVTDMIEQCQKGSSEKLTSADRNTILDALTSLRDEVYATGNADYAGRSVFTGYRTEDTLKFIEEHTTKTYAITEQKSSEDIDIITYVDTDMLNTLNDANFDDAGYEDIVEQNISQTPIYRMRLAYTDVDGLMGNMYENYYKSGNGTSNYPQLEYYAGNGTFDSIPSDAFVSMKINDNPSPYEVMASDPNYASSNDPNNPNYKVIIIEETGEMLLSEDVYNALMSAKDDPNTEVDESEVRVTYQKSDWKKDDLKPEHYFACQDVTESKSAGDVGTTKTIYYNENYLTGTKEKQVIEYDIGMNQSIRVNTTADEVFQHAIGRDVDDLVNAMKELCDIEDTVSKLEGMLENHTEGTPNYETVKNQLEAANKARTFIAEKVQKLFEGSITKMQQHLDTVNLATTNAGTRSKKLELISNRLMSQKTNFETLKSENEDADVEEVAVQLSSAELTYQAALMATGKIMQTTLMNYI